MNRKFKMSFVHRYIRNNGAVICFVTPLITDSFTFEHFEYYANKYGDGKIQRLFKGVAKLQQGDVSNIELAEKIARLKAERQCIKYYKNVIAENFLRIINYTYDTEKHMEGMEKRINDLTEQITNITQE